MGCTDPNMEPVNPPAASAEKHYKPANQPDMPVKQSDDWTDRFLGRTFAIIALQLVGIALVVGVAVFVGKGSPELPIVMGGMQICLALWGALVSVKKPWAERHHKAILFGYFLFAVI